MNRQVFALLAVGCLATFCPAGLQAQFAGGRPTQQAVYHTPTAYAPMPASTGRTPIAPAPQLAPVYQPGGSPGFPGGAAHAHAFTPAGAGSFVHPAAYQQPVAAEGQAVTQAPYAGGCCNGCGHGGCGHGCDGKFSGLFGLGWKQGCGCHDFCHGEHICIGNFSETPLYRLRGESLSLHRDIANDIAFSFAGSSANPVLTTRSDLDFQFETSFRLELERRWGKCDSVELVYFGLHDWDDTASVTDPNRTLLTPFNVFVLGFDGVFRQEIQYSSTIHNAEANYWRPLKWQPLGIRAALMTGVRFFNLQEDFALLGNDNVQPTSGRVDIKTRNNLVGWQLGYNMALPLSKNLSLRTDGKAGIYLNAVDVRTNITRTSNGVVVSSFNEALEETDGAFIGELNAIASYVINCHWMIYGGYQAMWVESVALAPVNFNPVFPGPTGRPGSLDNDGGVFYQGLRAGFDFTW